MDNDGLRYGATESALRPSLPTATRSDPHTPNLLHFAEAQIHARLTNPAKQNIITSIRGSRPPVADFKSEPRPASNRNRWPASYWNAWPASSVSAASTAASTPPIDVARPFLVGLCRPPEGQERATNVNPAMTLPELAAPHPPTLMSTSVPSERPKLIDDARKAPEGHKVRARPRVEFGKALLNATVLVRAASLQVEAGVVVARSHSDPSMIPHGPSSAAGRARRGHDKARAGESASGSGKMFRPTKLVTCNMLPVRFLRWGRACPDDEPGIGRPTTELDPGFRTIG